jgi:hypothetical protein
MLHTHTHRRPTSIRAQAPFDVLGDAACASDGIRNSSDEDDDFPLQPVDQELRVPGSEATLLWTEQEGDADHEGLVQLNELSRVCVFPVQLTNVDDGFVRSVRE